MIAGYAFFSALISSLILVRIVRRASTRRGLIARPREDRWHKQPTPLLGGVGIFLAFIISLATTFLWDSKLDWPRLGLLVGSFIIFCLGLYDDIKKISPPAKLIGQILAAAIVVLLGYTTNFFTPKIDNPIIAQIPNLLLTFLWIVGITNAINLLDNMDGLAAGISLITAGFLIYFFWLSKDWSLLVIACALAGSVLGFLFYNFPPATIFMGDSGSLFIGFTLAVLAIARQPQASNVFAITGVPTLLFLLPILDTSLVALTRILRGQSPVIGGRDHTSHRLIAFGFSERQTLLVLYSVAIASGVVAIAIETIDYWLSLILVPTLVITLALLVAYLGRLKVVSSTTPPGGGAFSRFMVELTYKRRLLEILLDFFLIGLSFYLAILLTSGTPISISDIELFLTAIPLAFLGSYLSFFYFGVYRGVWRYVGIDDMLRYAKAALGGAVFVAAAIYLLFPKEDYPRGLIIWFGLSLFLTLAASRSSFKILDLIYGRQARSQEERVLIIGAGDAGEMVVRWLLMNPSIGYRPIGFLDSNLYNSGRQIHGVPILGDFSQLVEIIENKNVDGIVVTQDPNLTGEALDSLIKTCHELGRWVRNLKLEFELMEYQNG
jgi:UDP-GlcNAc:undecaprenyl-phosphate/decaprenyl-phosphate GlcNAc-1-phosphate transferase